MARTSSGRDVVELEAAELQLDDREALVKLAELVEDMRKKGILRPDSADFVPDNMNGCRLHWARVIAEARKGEWELMA
ncbi:hypothetical protein B0A48_01956 [Cryoendolithus antarcticus]|uniref:Uncharacterized protein n=1 Tax=Cryoendolithus antarcticus TaxID=1507870 RepID=A0A1V8TQR6_9PEZI|nr:hypothetical protein B0A48_01956 [Cryoendolithus antarcticus]